MTQPAPRNSKRARRIASENPDLSVSQKPAPAPRTAAGRTLLTRIINETGLYPHPEAADAIEQSILAVEAEAAQPQGYSGLIAVARNATEQGLTIHVATRRTCAEHLEHGDDKRTEPLTTSDFPQPQPSGALRKHEAHFGNHLNYACDFSGAHCWGCGEPWPCRASRGSKADALWRYTEALSRGLSDAESREEGWPIAALAAQPQPSGALREALSLVSVIDASEKQNRAVAEVLDHHRPTPDRRTCHCGQFFRDDEEVRQRWEIHAAAAVLHALAAAQPAEGIRDALIATSTQTIDDGLCWCPGYRPQGSDQPHQIQCQQARAALDAAVSVR